MRRSRLLLLKLLIILCDRSMSHCDTSTTARVQEGNLGQTADFNWLGVFRVHLHDADSVQIAVSGIVLIKIKHAIINADDVARIPQRVFETESQAMFLQGTGTPWFVPATSYVTHPEYEYSTSNTIAIIELNIYDAENYPLNPICLPTSSFDVSNMYLTGYTDENKLLEKVFYKIRYLGNDACEEFYNRVGLSDKKRVPTTYLCGYAPYNGTQCVWDNGMALVTNATGFFTLIGFGIRGPGCSAPARFIDLQPYFHWINTATSEQQEMYDSPDYRRIDDTEYVPAHELFTKNTSRRQFSELAEEEELDDGLMRHYEPYPFNHTKPKQFTIEEADNAIAILPFNESLEWYENACKAHRVLMYREYFELSSENIMGSTTYKLSLYDLINGFCVCVELTVDCSNRSLASLAFKEEFHFSEGTRVKSADDHRTPEELFRFYPVTEAHIEEPDSSGKWKPKPHLTPSYLKFVTGIGNVYNFDLFIRFDFYGHAIMKFAMFATRDQKIQTPDYNARRFKAKVKKNKTSGKNKKSEKNREWGLRPMDKRVKEPVVSVVAEHAVVQETVSGACPMRPETFAVLVLGNFVLNLG